jgi:hypothetical protein
VADLQPIVEYLRWWGDPRGVELAVAIHNAARGTEQREQAALAFGRLKQDLPVSPVPAQTKAILDLLLGDSPDIVARRVALGKAGLPVLFVYTDNMIQKEFLVLLMDNLVVRLRDEVFPVEPDALWRYLEQRGLTGTGMTPAGTISDLVRVVLTGGTILLVQGLDRGIAISTQGWDHRQPEEPTTEPVVRGPKEGFVEVAAVNLVLVRRRLADERLRMEQHTVGTRTGTAVYLLYMTELALPELVDEVRQRIKRISIDGILESGMLEELIEDTPFTPFPLMKATERPDVVAGGLLEGKVAIVVDGTPHVLLAPITLAGAMQAAEDYYERWLMASFIRLLRYFFLVVALLGPSLYIGMTTYHHEMLPTDLLLSLAAAREGVPFPAVVEALLMEFTFEALREAGVRLPKTVGQAVSIVGALVIGEAAVRARIVSPVMVIVVSITGISSFVIPSFSTALAIRLLRFPLMLLTGVFGFYGLLLGLLALSIHLAGLRSFGVPYMSPTMPPTPADFRDLMIRVPWWAMRKRPQFMPVQNRRRQSTDLMPQPPGSSQEEGEHAQGSH